MTTLATAPAICTTVTLRLEETADGENPFAGTPAVYTTPDHVRWTHSLSNSLGHREANNATDVTVLLDGTQEQQIEYIQGILIAAIIIFSFFTLWILILLILKCCGYRRVGFFSGQRIRRPMPPTPPVLSESFSIQNVSRTVNQSEARVTESKKAKRILAALEQEEESLALQPTTVLQDEEAQSLQPQATGVADRRSNELSKAAVMVEYRATVQAWQQKVKRTETVQRRIRIVVIFCCLAVIVSAILMLVYGVGAIKNSMNQVQSGLDQTSALATSAIKVVNEFFVAQNNAVNVTESVMYNVNTICPPVQETLCQDIFMQTDCNLTGVPFQDEIQQVIQVFDDILIETTQTTANTQVGDQQVVNDTLQQAQDKLDQVEDVVNQVQDVLDTVKYELFKALTGAKSELQKVVDESEEVNQKVASYEWAFNVAAAFAICLAVLSVFIMIGVVLAWRNELNGSCFRWVRNLIVVPIFVILVLLSLVFCCVFVIGSITTSDVCYQSPDALVLHALETNLYPDLIKSNKEFGPILAKFITFYVQGCPEDVVPLDIDEMLRTKLNYVNDVVTPLQSVLASEEFTDICGSNNGLTNGMQAMLEIMCVVSLLVLDVRDLLNCNNGNSVYTTFAYEAVCYDATKGFVWICSTQLAIVFFSMLIMTLRVACFEIEDEEDFMKQRKWCARLCCCGSSKDEENDDHDEGGRHDDDNEDHGGATGYKHDPIKTLDSDGDAALHSMSVREEEEHGEPPRAEKRLEPTTEVKIY